MHKIVIKPNFSFWETQTYFKDTELIIVGSGIVGLSAAISYKDAHPKSRIIVLERGVLPYGASSKNAGFACFGSVSELLSDLQTSPEETVWATVEMRIKGLSLLRKRLGDKQIDYKEWGGYELFENNTVFETCTAHLSQFNKQVQAITGSKNTYSIANKKINTFGFKQVKGLILNKKEGQIDTGKMIKRLIELAQNKGIIILNSVQVNSINDSGNDVELATSIGMLRAKRVIIATNGFANELIKKADLKPARAQVLITKPIKDLAIKGTFHYDEGYYYFRNIGKRVLFGGGRNLDFEKETSTNFEINPKIQGQLEKLLKTIILPGTNFEIEQRWCGIMGVGSEKKPIIKTISTNVVCAVRMGGMGVAIGSLVGKMAVEKFD